MPTEKQTVFNGRDCMPSIECTFFRDSHDRWGQRVATTWDKLAERCARHDEGTKDGPALSAGLFDGPRGNATLTHRTLVALDIEEHRTTGEVPIAAQEMADYLTVRRIKSVLWTTHSHTADKPRYRVVLPLAEPIAYVPDIDPYIAAAVAAELRCAGVCDASKYGAASLFYLPRHAAGAPYWWSNNGGEIMSNGRLETAALMAAQRIATDEAEAAALRRAHALPPEVMERINGFNNTHAVPVLLDRYGYQRDGTRWRSRYQHGQGATSVLPDGKVWTSFSESDAQAGVGQRPARPSSQCACWGDAFALYVHYQFRNNFRAALAAIPDRE